MKIISDENRPDMIFKHEGKNGKVSYSMGISKKQQDGSNLKSYIPVTFKKGVEVPNKSLIIIEDGWMSTFQNNNKDMVNYIFINKFRIASQGYSQPTGTSNYEDYKTPIAVSDDELPF